MFPKGNKVDGFLSIYLEVTETANVSEGWNIYAKSKIFVFNQLDPDMTIILSIFLYVNFFN